LGKSKLGLARAKTQDQNGGPGWYDPGMSTLIRQLELPGIDLDLSALDSWVKQFPEKEVRKAVSEIEQQQEALARVRQDLEARLALFEQLAHPLLDLRQPPAPPVEQATGDGGNGRGLSVKRQAILQMLGREPRQKFPFPAISNNLIARGLMDDSEKSRKALSVMLSSMIDRGEIHRPVRAHYKFGPDPKRGEKTEDPSIAGVQTS